MNDVAADRTRRIADLVITMRDGVELAGDLCLPIGAEGCPILVSVYPYRKDDICGAFNEYWRRRFAASGYGTLLVDSRGTGASRGTQAQAAPAEGEAQDAYEIVEWAAAQPWSTGGVGIWGNSYGGAIALATAARRPPHLRAALCVYGYEDAYLDGVFPGGWSSGMGRLARESFMLALALAPPARRDPGGRWSEVWEQRLEETRRRGPLSLAWLEHRDRDAYWQELRTDISQIEVPTFLVVGWRDLFPAAMTRVYQRLRGPKRILAGPWLHVSPELAAREPMDWFVGAVRFWDEWLGSDAADAVSRPRANADELAAEPPAMCYVEGVGEWRHYDDWPPSQCRETSLHLGPEGTLGSAPEAEGSRGYDADPTVGLTSGLMDPLGVGLGYPLDQSADEARSLNYTAAPCEEPLELAGAAAVELCVELEHGANVMLSAKLTDVSPDGTSALIARGWLNGAHADGHEAAVPLAPGRRHALRIELGAIAYSVAPGHRLRLVIACADFPTMWPAGENARIRVHHGAQPSSRVLLPTYPNGAPRVPAHPPPVPDRAEDLSPWDVGGAPEWTAEQDLVAETVAMTLGGLGQMRLPDGTEFELQHRARAEVARERPGDAGLEATARIVIKPAQGGVVVVNAVGRHTRTSMRYEGSVEVDGRTVFSERWQGG